ncbi:unnamed protein product [Polarella glacialis]|uniref:Uncharacterized protein n=1 Tax=Polarella glacialis TaxID=89957 RepID=A0A813JMU4_POLGL|nr:unnamed protein product [Polarella glacialis]
MKNVFASQPVLSPEDPDTQKLRPAIINARSPEALDDQQFFGGLTSQSSSSHGWPRGLDAVVEKRPKGTESDWLPGSTRAVVEGGNLTPVVLTPSATPVLRPAAQPALPLDSWDEEDLERTWEDSSSGSSASWRSHCSSPVQKTRSGHITLAHPHAYLYLLTLGGRSEDHWES